MELHAKYTIFAEVRAATWASSSSTLQARRRPRPAELRHRPEGAVGDRSGKHQPGLVVHTAGWPLDAATYGGSFLYHAEDNKVALGFVVGLDYANPG